MKKKPLDIKALDVFLSAVEDRLNHLEQKMGMYADEDREPVSEDTLEKKRVCPECGMPEGDCKCGYFDTEVKAAMTLGSDLKEGATVILDGKRTTLLRFGYTQFGTDGGPMWEVEADIDGTPGTVEIHSERTYEVVKGSGAEHTHAKTYIVDAETKVRYVRDAAYWGVPVLTPITPGMKPQGPTSPAGRARRSSMTGRGIRRSMPSTASGGDKTPGRAAPRKRVRPKNGPATQERRESAANVAANARSASRGGKKPRMSGPVPEGAGPKRPKLEEGERGKFVDSANRRASAARVAAAAGEAAAGGRGGKKPPSKPTPSASGDDKPKRPDWAPESAERVHARDIRPGDTIHTKPRSDMFASTFEVSSVSEHREPAMDDGPGARGNATSRVSIRGKNKNERMTLGEGTHWVTRGKGSGDTGKPDNSGKEESGSHLDTSVRDAKDFSVKSAAEELKKIPAEGRPDATGELDDPIDCGSDIEKAQKLLGEGKHIRLNTPLEASMLMEKLAEEAEAAKKEGKGTPDYDLCRVSIPGKNLFCQGNKGIERAQMPQFSGQPVEGSYAATKFNEEKGESNVEAEFAQLLEEMGIGVEEKTVKAQDLKATQSQLVGTKVSGMRKAMREGKIKDAPIYVTRDGYIVDGHHRWAAKMGLDIEDGVLGDVDMPVRMIDAEIGQILDISNGFTEMAGIRPKATGAAAEGVPGGKPTTGRSGDSVVLQGVGTVVQSDNTQGKKWWDIRDNFSKKSDDDCGCSGNA